VKGSKIYVCSSPSFGHSVAHAGLPVLVESGCGAVAVGSAYLFPPLSSGGASIAGPLLRFHTPLIEPDVRY
jgi:hypothetical protein